MIEVVAVGVAAVITGIAAKGLAPLARMVGGGASSQPDHPLLPDAYWDESLVPGSVYGPTVFSARITWPYEGASFQVKVEFRYFLPVDRKRPILYRTEWGGLIEDQGRRLKILREVQQTALRLYAQPTLDAIAQHKANLELATIEKAWLDALEADKTRVVAELRAGRQAQFSRDWRAEAARDGNAATQQARKAALELSLGSIEALKQRLMQAAERAERERAEAVRRAAGDAERERRVREAEAAEQARLNKLSGRIPLAPDPAGIVFGTRIKDGVDFVVPFANLQHMLISGVTGAGKSVLMHALLYQLLRSDEVERLVLIDLKGGVSFYRYRDSPKVEVVYEMPDVMRVIDGLMALMVQRQNYMRENGIEFWRDGRVFVVIDEYAEIQTEIDSADTKEAKAAARRLAANLASISRRARALGIVLVCALQRPTVDAMDAAVRNNLNCRICMRAATNQLAASMLDDLERFTVQPTELPTGQFYYYNASRGLTRLLKAQIAPGVDLADVS
jgi:S-DNA-T family DNA segregation ATPase FtsK/SpoIIIE